MPIDLTAFDEDAFEEFGPGEVIFTQGDLTDHMYFVVEGEVALKVAGSEVARVGEGGLLGEMALLDGSPRSALAESVGDTRLLALNRSRFEETVRRNPDFARTVLLTLAQRIRRMNVEAGGTGGDPDLSSGDITGRLDLSALQKHQNAFKAGETIFEEGALGRHMYIVQSGAVELRVGGKVVHTVETGGFFGEMALVEEAPRSASAHATTDCRLLPIDADRFETLVGRTPDFVVEMMRVMARRLRWMDERKKEAMREEAGEEGEPGAG